MVGYNVVVEAVEERRKIACRAAAAGKWAKWATAKMVGVSARPWGRLWTKRRKHRAHAVGARACARPRIFFKIKRNGFLFIKKNLTPERSSSPTAAAARARAHRPAHDDPRFFWFHIQSPRARDARMRGAWRGAQWRVRGSIGCTPLYARNTSR
jgi:hypothetical protein